MGIVPDSAVLNDSKLHHTYNNIKYKLYYMEVLGNGLDITSI